MRDETSSKQCFDNLKRELLGELLYCSIQRPFRNYSDIYLFSQKAPSWMFDWVLNTPLER